MMEIKNDCVDCQIRCIDCGKRRTPHYYCDICGKERKLYSVDGEEICMDCMLEKYPDEEDEEDSE